MTLNANYYLMISMNTKHFSAVTEHFCLL
ncbi:MAG: hypothetical protein LZF60_140047 [Nitrospira sp.]|nr:MAG: hypothetical protein LZF60_140047 [Nitrospira sp.]